MLGSPENPAPPAVKTYHCYSYCILAFSCEMHTASQTLVLSIIFCNQSLRKPFRPCWLAILRLYSWSGTMAPCTVETSSRRPGFLWNSLADPARRIDRSKPAVSLSADWIFFNRTECKTMSKENTYSPLKIEILNDNH